MKSKKARFIPQAALPFIVLINLTSVSFSQNTDTTKVVPHFGGIVTVSSKGISMVPNLSLGKPAVMFDISMGKGRLSFEPQLRFALEGKPWSFIFWWRYKLIKTGKFRLNLGAHPALSFKTYSFPVGEVPEEHLVVRRYLAGELAPTCLLNKDVSIGIYYLYSRGIEKELTRNTNMISLRGSFSNIRLSKQFYMKLNPQIYYLNMDNIDGTYFNASMTVARKNFPLSASAMINQPLKTNIAAGNEFLWNVSLIYSFNKEYIEK
jgi:hypothetical protein